MLLPDDPRSRLDPVIIVHRTYAPSRLSGLGDREVIGGIETRWTSTYPGEYPNLLRMNMRAFGP